MATILPTNDTFPVKQYLHQVRFKLDDGSVIEVQPTAARRSIMIGILNSLAQFQPTFPAGRSVLGVEIDLGNQQDVIKR